MVNILVCADGFFRTFSPISLEPYIESFINTLVRNGNNVMPYIKTDFNSRFSLKRKYFESKISKEIKEFNPDLIFAFNNAIDSFILKLVDCPINIIASDTPVYWKYNNTIKNNPSRYSVFYFNDDMSGTLTNEYKIPLSRQIKIPYSTDMHAFEVTNTPMNISFIGNFYNPSSILSTYTINSIKKLSKQNKIKLQQCICELIDELRVTRHKSNKILSLYKKIITLTNTDIGYDKFLAQTFIALTQENRQLLLKAICDFDLHIFTWDANLQCIENNYELFKCCHFESCANTKENELVYNSSKISLSLPHAQVDTGFSWRVCDILASNSLLLSNKSDDLTQFFGGIVPTYSTPEDLRDKCNYFIKHKKEREAIVKQCNKMINKNHRFENIFKIIGDYTNYSLLNTSKKGQLKNLSITEKKQMKYIRNLKNNG